VEVLNQQLQEKKEDFQKQNEERTSEVTKLMNELDHERSETQTLMAELEKATTIAPESEQQVESPAFRKL